MLAHLEQQQKLFITVSEDMKVYEQVQLLVKPCEVIKPNSELADMLRRAVNVGVRLTSTSDVRCCDFLFLTVRRGEGKRLVAKIEKKRNA